MRNPPDRAVVAHARQVFLAILPRIELHGRVCFRHVKCLDRKEDAVAEMIALAWSWCLRLVQRGKDPEKFPCALATFAARAVHSGRRLCGQDRAKDVLSVRAQRAHGFAVAGLPEVSTLCGNPLDEALQDNARTPVPEQVSFRLDFPAWRRTRCRRDRRIVDQLLLGEGTLAVARRHSLSPARISQLRREFRDDWSRYCGETDEASIPPNRTGGLQGPAC
jgi:hypothetical protein